MHQTIPGFGEVDTPQVIFSPEEQLLRKHAMDLSAGTKFRIVDDLSRFFWRSKPGMSSYWLGLLRRRGHGHVKRCIFLRTLLLDKKHAEMLAGYSTLETSIKMQSDCCSN